MSESSYVGIDKAAGPDFTQVHLAPTGKRPQVWFLEVGGDPSNDKENYKRYSSTEEFKAVGLDEEVLCLIEKWAYDQIKNDFEDTMAFVNPKLRKVAEEFDKMRSALRCVQQIAKANGKATYEDVSISLSECGVNEDEL